MPKNNVIQMRPSTRTRMANDAEAAAHETQEDWQRLIAEQVADLQHDIEQLMENVNYYDDTYGAIPGDAPLMQHLAQAGQTLLDAAQDHDQTWCEDAEHAQRYLDHIIMGREYRDLC